MWASAQRDGRPAKYRWRHPLFNAAKFGWRPIFDCRAVTLQRRETRWNFPGCPKLPDRSQPLVGRSSPYYQDMWRRYCCLTFFPIVDTCLSCEDIAWQSCTMVRRWRLFVDFLRPAFPASRVQHVSDLHPKFALRPHHVWKCGKNLFFQYYTKFTYINAVWRGGPAIDACARHARRHAKRHELLCRQSLTESKYVRITTDALTATSRHVRHGQCVRRVAECVRIATNTARWLAGRLSRSL